MCTNTYRTDWDGPWILCMHGKSVAWRIVVIIFWYQWDTEYKRSSTYYFLLSLGRERYYHVPSSSEDTPSSSLNYSYPWHGAAVHSSCRHRHDGPEILAGVLCSGGSSPPTEPSATFYFNSQYRNRRSWRRAGSGGTGFNRQVYCWDWPLIMFVASHVQRLLKHCECTYVLYFMKFQVCACVCVPAPTHRLYIVRVKRYCPGSLLNACADARISLHPNVWCKCKCSLYVLMDTRMCVFVHYSACPCA